MLYITYSNETEIILSIIKLFKFFPQFKWNTIGFLYSRRKKKKVILITQKKNVNKGDISQPLKYVWWVEKKIKGK